ncbi:MAG: hypothetical protein LBU38_05690 [Propionibacteriaceae bacterium]|jgi:hypothetical protein|nr:hypothetical protein [Propionibacteriaceae bacterium]
MVVPTTLRRHHLTEIPELREALDVARAAWPEEKSTTSMIYRLAAAGAAHLLENPDTARAARRAKASELAGRHPAVLDAGYLDELRREWDR